jgi:hypothetical protein
LSDSNFGVQWHIVSMYAPSFITGSLIARFGAPVVVALGPTLEALAATIALSGVTAMHFWATPMAAGCGMEFRLCRGLRARAGEPPQERNKVQGTMAVGSFSSGQLLANYGWSAVNMAVYPPVALGLLVLALTSLATRRGRAGLQEVDEFPEPSI